MRDLLRANTPVAIEVTARIESTVIGNMEPSLVLASDSLSLSLAALSFADSSSTTCFSAATTVNSVSAVPVSETIASVCLPADRVSR